MPFAFCDAIINDIFRVLIPNNEHSELFWSMFLAFDEGEYFHNNDRGEDPEEKYTRPIIAEIVAKNP